MNEHVLPIPLQDDDIARLQIGDVVFLNGTIYTGREGLYSSLYDKHWKMPIPLAQMSNVTFHCSPAIREHNGQYDITSVTATASFRFARYIGQFIRDFGVKAVIGKSGMALDVYKKAFVPDGAVYLSTIGYGAGAIYGRSIVKVEDVLWKEELGLAQAVWILQVEKFGPLLVESDARGNSLFGQENARINNQFFSLYDGLAAPVLRRLGEETDPREEMV
jgi:L(+)-tartrate dehydratase beta subunit